MLQKKQLNYQYFYLTSIITNRSAEKLKEPKVITDFDQRIIRLLPTGFYFNNQRWDMIWKRFDAKGGIFSMTDLRKPFPDEAAVQYPSKDDSELFNRKPDS